MKLKNIEMGDFVQIKKSLCHSEFKAKQVCEVIDIDYTSKRGFNVLIQDNDYLDWVKHKDLRKPREKLKQLDHSVFNGLDSKWKYAAVDADGDACIYTHHMTPDSVEFTYCDYMNFDCEVIGTGYDATDWKNSLIKRDIAKELLEVDLSSELTGSDLCRAMLERGDKIVTCAVKNYEDELDSYDAIIAVSSNGKYYESTSNLWSFAVPINNQGEPLTASDVGI